MEHQKLHKPADLANFDYIVYTDGGCKNTSIYCEGAAAYIILSNGVEVKRASKAFLHTTNNRMEMLAIISAIASLPKGSSVCVFSDSQLATNVFNRSWKAKKNLDLVAKYFFYAKGLNIKFHWVKGHNGNKYNEQMDSMCTDAMNDIIAKYNFTADRFTKKKASSMPGLFP